MQQRTPRSASLVEPTPLCMPPGLYIPDGQAAFCRAEGKEFRRTLVTAADEAPQLYPFLKAIAERIENPLLRFAAVDLTTSIVMRLKESTEQNLKALGRVAGNQVSEGFPTHLVHEAKDEVMGPVEGLRRRIDELVAEIIERAPQFKERFSQLMNSVEEFNERRHTLQPIEKVFENVGVRNYLTSQAFPYEIRELLFWDFDIMLRALALNAAFGAWELEQFRSMQESDPEFLAQAMKKAPPKIRLLPNGAQEEITVAEYYTKHLPEQRKPSEVAALRAVTSKYFSERTTSVYGRRR